MTRFCFFTEAHDEYFRRYDVKGKKLTRQRRHVILMQVDMVIREDTRIEELVEAGIVPEWMWRDIRPLGMDEAGHIYPHVMHPARLTMITELTGRRRKVREEDMITR